MWGKGITKWGKMGLQSGAKRLQSGARITKWGKGITKWGKFWDYKVGQDGITKWGSFLDYKVGQKDYKVGQGLQSGAGIIKWCSTYTTYFPKVLLVVTLLFQIV